MFGDGSTVEQRAARRKRDGSILDSLTGSLSRLRNESERPGSRAARRLHRERSRDRAPAANCHEGLDRRADRYERAGRRAANLRRTHQAAVRSAGAGLPGGHHPRRHAAVCARPHRPDLSRKRSAHLGFPWRVASRRRSEANRRALEDQPVSRQDAGASGRASWRRPRMATARCWIIRWFSTAATWATPISTSTTMCRTCWSAD